MTFYLLEIISWAEIKICIICNIYISVLHHYILKVMYKKYRSSMHFKSCMFPEYFSLYKFKLHIGMRKTK